MSKNCSKILSRLAFGVTLLLISFSLSACEKRTSEKEKFGGTLYLCSPQKMAPLNPLTTDSSLSTVINDDLVYRGLVKNMGNGFFDLDLAESLTPSEDGKTVAVTLKKGITFHDGRELTAKDIRFTYNLAQIVKSSPYSKSLSSLVDKIVVEGKYRLKIYTKKKIHKIENFLSLVTLPSHILEGHSDPLEALSRNPIGAGPYKVTHWSPEKILLEANNRYYEEGPYIEKIVITSKKDDSTCWAELVKGNIDLYPQKTPNRLEALEKDNSIRKARFISPYYHLVAFNRQNPLYNDRRIRKALNYAINKKRIIEDVLGGYGEMMRGPIFLNLLSDSKKGTPFPYNPKKAKQLLLEAGVDGLNMRILLPRGEDFLQNTLRYIKEDLSHIGVSLTTDLLPLKETMEKIYQKDFDLSLIYLSSHIGPEESYFFWHSSQIEKGFNKFSYSNREVDTILNQLLQKESFPEQKILYEALNKAMIEDPPGIYLFWVNSLAAINSRVTIPSFSGPRFLNNINEWYILPPNRKH